MGHADAKKLPVSVLRFWRDGICAHRGAILLFGTVYRFSSWEIVGHGPSLWESLYHLPACRREAHDDEFWDLQKNNVTNAVVLLIGIGVGLATYRIGVRRRRPDQHGADYKESTGGPVPDGRASTGQ